MDIPREIDADEVLSLMVIETNDGKRYSQFKQDWISIEEAKRIFCEETEYDPEEVTYVNEI